MALFDRNQKLDSRRSSSFCSTATIIVFVALCLLGIWMITSSDNIPSAMSLGKKSEAKEEDVSIDATNNVKQEGGNIPQATITTNNQDAVTEKTDEVDNLAKPTDEAKGEGDNPSKNQSFDDENGKTESGELVKLEANETDGAQDKNIDQNIKETPSNATENSSDASKTQAYEDENGKLEGMELVKEERKAVDKNNPEETASNDQKDGKKVLIIDDYTNNGTTKNQTFLDENGKAEVGDLVKENVEESTAKKKEEGTNSSNEMDNVSTDESTIEEKKPDSTQPIEAFPSGQAELLNETTTQSGAFSTQAAESKKEKKMRAQKKKRTETYNWKLCNSSAEADYIPCLDNEDAIRKLRSTKHYEHRERHCPLEAPTCLVPLPQAYKQPIQWPHSRDKIWYHNVPHTKLAAIKGHQNWVKVSGEYLTFPGGGTQFKHGALHYIDIIQEALPDIAWGKRSRVVLDVGCGVASFGGYLFERDALTMSFAPKDEHEAQVQFALERGIPAMSAVMGTKRLPYPSNVFDVIHCARCRVPWHIEGGMLLLELNRLLRPGGFFVWSATPVYQKLPEDVEIWNDMVALTKSVCWEMLKKTKDTIDQVGVVVFRKPSTNDCYQKRKQKDPPLCEGSDDPNAAWNITLQACMHKVPVDPSVRGVRWPEQWPERLEKAPYWLNSSQVGVYGKPAPDDFVADYEHWKKAVKNSYLTGMGIDWATVRNVMDMRAVYGGFAAALRDMNVWVMNVVTIDSPDTLPIIYERGLFGIYHDWCESFSTYPRSYDLLHADHLFSKLKTRCKLLPVMVEVDRILRPDGKLIVRDDRATIGEVENIMRSLHWEVRMTFSKQKEGLLCVKKTMWRPTEVEATR